MLTIISPMDSPEIDYALDMCLGHFLGLQYKVEVDTSLECFQISSETGTYVLSINCCFDLTTNPDSYNLMVKQDIGSWIPGNFGIDANLIYENLPLMFGEGIIKQYDNGAYCGVDIFSTVFFMMSRIEEMESTVRDEHGRFPATASIAYKENFLERPIVDEYVEVLWQMLKYINPLFKRRLAKSEIYISCDVDEPFDHTVDSFHMMLKTCLADIVKRKSIALFNRRVVQYFLNKVGNYSLDKNYSFPWYMDTCEKHRLKIAFYFIPTSKEPGNGSYEITEKRIQKLMRSILSRNHEIGVHSSYQTFNDSSKMKFQKELLSKTVHSLEPAAKVAGNRQHYLRWDSCITPSIADSAGFTYDTSGGYADRPGFRFGTSKEFPMWDVLGRRRLGIIQRPLVVMDVSIYSENI